MYTSLKLEKVRTLTETTHLARNDAGVEFLVVSRPESEAIISLFGAHLIHFAQRDQRPWFWLSSEAVIDGSRGIRGGVPICWPWFGPSPERVGLGKPQHGFARTSLWQLDGISDYEESTLLHLSLQDSEASRAIWPHAFTLEYDLLISDDLTLMLTTRNESEAALIYSGALHSYFAVSAPESVTITGLGPSYLDKLDQGKEKNSGIFQLNEPIDRVYTQPETITRLEAGSHQLTLEHGNADSIVAWTPWIDGAKAMNDVNDDAWTQMVCVETAITSTAGLVVQPDNEHSLSVKISRM
jgi:glucose-6-phosphate 1-epimerase